MDKIENAPIWYNTDVFTKAMESRDNEELKALVNKINDGYLYWDKIKYKKTPDGISPEVLWAAVKLSRVTNSKNFRIGDYKFQFNITDTIQKGLHEFDLNLGGNLGSNSVIPESDKRRYLISSIMEEAIASSQIEGAATTRKKAKEMLRKSIKPTNKSEQMIVNNYKTIKHIVEIKNEPITKERLFQIHKLIADETLDDQNDVGVYRDNNDVNVIDVINGDVVHIPPTYEQISDLMEELFVFFNDDNKEDIFIHPVIKGCIIHFMIGFIHPFVDGNGRTARALFYWYLLKNGYWLTEYLSISRLIVKSKNQYSNAFRYTEIDGNDLTYFINYKISTMRSAFYSLKEYIDRKINEKKQFINFQKINGINERQALIIKWIYEEVDLILSVKEIENRFNVANQTARTDLQELEKRGYLKAINLNKKTKGFFRSDSFEDILANDLPDKN